MAIIAWIVLGLGAGLLVLGHNDARTGKFDFSIHMAGGPGWCQEGLLLRPVAVLTMLGYHPTRW